MISLDWKERLIRDSVDFFERKLPTGDFDFDIIYNAYPKRIDNKIPREVVTLVADTLASKMQKNHQQYVKFCDYIWQYKGENGKVVFACIISKFLKKDYDFYFDYAKKKVMTLKNTSDIFLMLEKIFLPLFKKQLADGIEPLINWLREGNENVNPLLVKMILRIGKLNPDFLKKFTARLENRWLTANEDFAKMCGSFLKSLGKIDKDLYLSIYKNYKTSREPVFVEILTHGLVLYDDLLFDIYENWSKSGNARLKKAALTGYKFLKKRKE